MGERRGAPEGGGDLERGRLGDLGGWIWICAYLRESALICVEDLERYRSAWLSDFHADGCGWPQMIFLMPYFSGVSSITFLMTSSTVIPSASAR